MNREDYKLYTWYPLTDDEYWVDVGVLQELFPDCKTIVCDIDNHIMTYNDCHIGWGTMAFAVWAITRFIRRHRDIFKV